MLKKIFTYSIIILAIGGTALYFGPQPTPVEAIPSEQPIPQQKQTPPEQLTPQQQVMNKLLTIQDQLTSPYQQAGLTFLMGDLNNEQLTGEQKLTKLNIMLDGQLIKLSDSDKQAINTLVEQGQHELNTKLTQGKNINSFFTLDLVNHGEQQGFTGAQTKDGINIGLQVDDYHYAFGLTNMVELDPLTVLNEGDDPDLREQYQEGLAHNQ